MFYKKILYWSVIVLFFGLLSLSFGNKGICSSGFQLDGEAVFCLYFKMSGEYMNDHDIEDLCFSTGRPTFSAYKPAEMFVKNSLMKLRDRLVKRMNNYNKDSMFRWSFRLGPEPNDSGVDSHKLFFPSNRMPQPTPFIGSELSKKGQRSVNKALDFLTARTLNLANGIILNITVYLRPERVDLKVQKRKIAGEDVFLPIRSVVFHPVKVEVFCQKNPDEMLLCYDIPCI